MAEIPLHDGEEGKQVEKDVQVEVVRGAVMQHFPDLWPAVEVGQPF